MDAARWEVTKDLWAFLASTGDVDPGEWPGLFAAMSPERQARCRRYRREADKARCILADALARRALAALSGLDGAAIVFQTAPEGKPSAPGTGLEFSLSHSGALVLCAAAPFPVGADLQRQKAVSAGLLRRAARAGYTGTSTEDFFCWWVRQEAAGKLTGKGLRLGPLPEDLVFWDKALSRDGEKYYCSICTAGAFLSKKSMI